MPFFVKLIEESEEFEILVKQRPTAFVLLTLIAIRARKVPLAISDGLEIGEALIGDFESYGATEQSYRTDKKYLKEWGFATFRSTNRGTIAKVVGSSIFDISRESSTSRSTGLQRASNGQPTDSQRLNKKVEEREKKKEKAAEIGTGGLAAPTTPASSRPDLVVLERWKNKGETDQEKANRLFWEQAGKDVGMSPEELKKRISR
jgi:hypothetical protein